MQIADRLGRIAEARDRLAKRVHTGRGQRLPAIAVVECDRRSDQQRIAIFLNDIRQNSSCSISKRDKEFQFKQSTPSIVFTT
jgi:hypothetical protein